MILLQNMIPTYILFRLFIFRFCVFEDFEHLLSKQKMCQFLWHGAANDACSLQNFVVF